MMHLNVQGIQGRAVELGGFLAAKRIDLCSLNETLLKCNHKLKINSYQVFRRDRTPPRSGGGVAILVHESVDAELVPLQSQEEIIMVRLPHALPSGSDLFVLSYYCPPNRILDSDMLLDLAARYPNLIIVGDLNSRHQQWGANSNSESGIKLIEFLDRSEHVMLNDSQLTYFSARDHTYGSLLDVVTATPSIGNLISNLVVTDEIHSDHHAILFNVRSSLHEDGRLHQFSRTSTNWDKLYGELHVRSPASSPITNSTQLSEAAAEFTNTLSSAIAAATTTKTFSLKTDAPLLLPRHILGLIELKRRARRTWQTTGILSDKIEYNRLTAAVKLATNNFKQKKWENFCSSLNGMNPGDSKLWKTLNSIDNNAQRPRACKLTNNSGQLTADPVEVASIFANHLASVYHEEADPSFNTANWTRVQEASPSFFSYGLSSPVLTSLTEVREIIKSKIGGRGAPGEDGISNKVLKLLSDHCIAASWTYSTLNLS